MKLYSLVLRFIKDHPGFVVLLGILTVISLQTIKPGFYFIGWDNYSSYFNLPTNIFRTFFATWRDYRGLGVPSDAEVTDIFRQLLFVPLGFFLPQQLLDQAYYLLALWLGVLGMYVLAGILVNDLPLLSRISEQKKDIFGFITALFYLFNLNTLSIFYSPIIPFTTRFFSLPLTLAIIIWFLRKKPTRKSFLIVAIIVIVTSGNYITPTVIITSLMAYGIFALSRFSFKNTFLYSVVFLALNAFWILPFINYTREKASIVPLARTFVEINESTLNRPESDFSLDKQVILHPSFFDLNFRSLAGQSFPVHPLLDEYTKFPWRIILFLFPFLYVVGAIIILAQGIHARRSLWIPAWIAIFIFLSMKEFSSLGFVYIWLKEHIHFFDIIFRISDTKFHAYVSLAGSIAAAYGIMVLFTMLRAKRVQIISITFLFIVGLGYAWPFRTYITGDLVGSLAYTKIPSAYFDVARVINDTPGEGRVLHLPMDSWHSYWRSFSWGYLGSSFFHYFINKPYIDKTFEPASMENLYLHSKINSFIDSFYRTSDVSQKKQIAGRFLQMLRDMGIQYVLLDESVSSNVYARNIYFDAKQWYVQAKEILEYIAGSAGLAHKDEYIIPLQDQYSAYKSLYPVRIIGFPKDAPSQAHIDVYEVSFVRPVMSFLPLTQNIDPSTENLLETNLANATKHVIQDETKPSQLQPFLRQNHMVVRDENSITLQYQNITKRILPYQITASPTDSDSYLIDVYGKIHEKRIDLTFYHRYYPDINTKRFQRYIGSVSINLTDENFDIAPDATILSNWTQNETKQVLEHYRLRLNDVVLPIPANISKKDTYISSYMLHEKIIRASVLTKSGVQILNSASFVQTDPASCFGSPSKEYEGDIKITKEGTMLLTTRNGSICGRASMISPDRLKGKPLYVEIELQLNAEQMRSKNPVSKDSPTPNLVEQVLKKEGEIPIQAYVCVREASIEDCLNPHRNIRVQPRVWAYRIPLRTFLSSLSNYPIDVGLVNQGDLRQGLIVYGVKQHTYLLSEEKDLAFVPIYEHDSVTISGPLQVSFPKAVSDYTYIHKPKTEAFYVPLGPCRGDDPHQRIVRLLGDTIFNYMINCSTHFAQWFRYAPELPYLFAFEYWLGSGQQPSIVMGRNGDNYLFERASLYQEYLANPHMKQFQDPRVFDSYLRVQKDLQNIQLTSASRLIEPLYFSDSAPTDVAIHLFQDTANEGITAIRSFEMIEYPAAWQHMTLTPQQSETVYPVPTTYSYIQLLPSLWRIDGSIRKGMLLFNEGYDKQWGIYESVRSLLFGKSIVKSVRCDGYANCFELGKDQEFRGKTLYVFYWPERLSMIGWGITLATVMFILGLIRRRKSSAMSPQ